jgi:hypothetical protein
MTSHLRSRFPLRRAAKEQVILVNIRHISWGPVISTDIMRCPP